MNYTNNQNSREKSQLVQGELFPCNTKQFSTTRNNTNEKTLCNFAEKLTSNLHQTISTKEAKESANFERLEFLLPHTTFKYKGKYFSLLRKQGFICWAASSPSGEIIYLQSQTYVEPITGKEVNNG